MKRLDLYDAGRCMACGGEVPTGTHAWCASCASTLLACPPRKPRLPRVPRVRVPVPELGWWTYVIGSQSGPVKIGKSRQVGSRLSHIQTGNPVALTVLDRVRGDHEAEAHACAAMWRMRGEWFKRSCVPTVRSLFAAIECR